MTQQFDAMYQGGVLLPVEGGELPLRDGDRVRITIKRDEQPGPQDVLRLAREVYEGLSAEEIEEVEQIAMDRSRFLTDGSD